MAPRYGSDGGSAVGLLYIALYLVVLAVMWSQGWTTAFWILAGIAVLLVVLFFILGGTLWLGGRADRAAAASTPSPPAGAPSDDVAQRRVEDAAADAWRARANPAHRQARDNAAQALMRLENADSPRVYWHRATVLDESGALVVTVGGLRFDAHGILLGSDSKDPLIVGRLGHAWQLHRGRRRDELSEADVLRLLKSGAAQSDGMAATTAYLAKLRET